jgi:hypothetical protein
MYEPKPPPPKSDRRLRSRVTNGSKLFLTGLQTTAASRRLGDVLRAIVSDLGGPDNLSEAERQLSRRAASLSVASVHDRPLGAAGGFVWEAAGVTSFNLSAAERRGLAISVRNGRRHGP